jgi:hypothetical protein
VAFLLFFLADGIEGGYWRPPSVCWPPLPLDPTRSFLERTLQQNLRDLDRLSLSLAASAEAARHGREQISSHARAGESAAHEQEQSGGHVTDENADGTFNVEARSPESASAVATVRPTPLNLSSLRLVPVPMHLLYLLLDAMSSFLQVEG